LNRNWNDTDVSVLPLYRELIAHGVRVWVFRLVLKCIYNFLPFVFSTMHYKKLNLATENYKIEIKFANFIFFSISNFGPKLPSLVTEACDLSRCIKMLEGL